MSTLNVVVVGYGMSAQIFHIPFIQHSPSLTLHTIVQRSPPSASSLPDPTRPYHRSAPQDHPDVHHHTSLTPALADRDVAVVVITTPPATHAALARDAINARKHVIVEKPFCPSAVEARALAALAREKRVVLCSYNNRRWDADFITLRGLLCDGSLGRLISLDSHFDRFRPDPPPSAAFGWKVTTGPALGGGPAYDLGSHLVDQACVLLGRPSSVYGRLTVARAGVVDPDCADTMLALLNYPDGATVVLRTGVLSVEERQPRFWARGSWGSWRKDGMDPQEAQLIAGKRPGDDGFGVDEMPGTLTVVGDYGTPTIRRQEEEEAEEAGEEGHGERSAAPSPATWAAFYEEFVKAVRGEGEVPVSADEAADVIEIIEAIVESARTGQEVWIE